MTSAHFIWQVLYNICTMKCSVVFKMLLGYETTANLLQFTVILVHQHADVLMR